MFNKPTFAVLAGLLALLTLTSCSDAPPQADSESLSRPVKLISVAVANDERATRYPAIIGAGTTAELSFVVGGVIKELPVSDASPVEAGDLIAKLDPRDFESNVASARASFSIADEEYQRAVRLAAQDAIAKNILEQRKAQRDVTRAQLDAAEKALADSVLRAPFTGVIASVPVRAQQTISPGTRIATVINVSTLDATINMPASVIARVPTREARGATVVLEAAADREIEATFSEADLVADATSQTYSVSFSFQPPENMIVLPGMNATVVLRSAGLGGERDAVSVPLAAVQSDGQGQYVWLVGDDMTVSRRAVEIADGIGETAVVNTGLSPGERIVGAGGAYLSAGMRVTAWVEQ